MHLMQWLDMCVISNLMLVVWCSLRMIWAVLPWQSIIITNLHARCLVLVTTWMPVNLVALDAVAWVIWTTPALMLYTSH